MSGRDRKINKQQREELVRVYLEGGINAAGPLAETLGVSKKYPGILAITSGRRRKGYAARDTNDPRWKWAIERGAISV